jgi:hypothetical protein
MTVRRVLWKYQGVEGVGLWVLLLGNTVVAGVRRRIGSPKPEQAVETGEGLKIGRLEDWKTDSLFTQKIKL